jgi:hypothetical protein
MTSFRLRAWPNRLGWDSKGTYRLRPEIRERLVRDDFLSREESEGPVEFSIMRGTRGAFVGRVNTVDRKFITVCADGEFNQVLLDFASMITKRRER